MSEQKNTAIIAPSILAADFSRLGEQCLEVPSAPWLHIDVMDGHFVPNLSFGLPVIDPLREFLIDDHRKKNPETQRTEQHLDVHLMIENPQRWAPDYAHYDSVTFHYEAVEGIEEARTLAQALRSQGTQAGIAIKPGTPVEPLLDYVEDFDIILIMSVEPGFGGQAFMPEVLDKVRALRAVIEEKKVGTLIEIDGGIGKNTAVESAQAGVDIFVAGSSIFGKENPDEALRDIYAAAEKARNQ